MGTTEEAATEAAGATKTVGVGAVTADEAAAVAKEVVATEAAATEAAATGAEARAAVAREASANAGCLAQKVEGLGVWAAAVRVVVARAAVAWGSARAAA